MDKNSTHVPRKVGTSHDNIAAFGSIAVTVFTFNLWRSTHKLWETTRESVFAAKQAAEALPRVERAYVFMVPDLKFGDLTIPRSSGIVTIASAFILKSKTTGRRRPPLKASMSGLMPDWECAASGSRSRGPTLRGKPAKTSGA